MARRILIGEWIGVTAVGSLLIAILSYPAFSAFFFAEDFSHWGSYVAHGRSFWATVFSAHDHIFFRPAVKAFGILSNLVLPASPWAYHVRNWLGLAACLGVLALLMQRLVESRAARLIGLAWFAVSKVHLTAIGFILIADAIFGLLQSLLALYTLVIYLQTRARWALAASAGFFALSVSARDYGVALFAAVAAAWFTWQTPAPWRERLRGAGPLLLYLAVGLIYFGVRLSVVEPIPAHSPYAAAFDPAGMLHRGAILVGNAWNVSLGEVYESGAGSLASWLLGDANASLARYADIAFAVAATVLFGWVALRNAHRSKLWPAALWAAGFGVPPLLVQNVQPYYLLEPLAALALLAALSLDTGPAPGPFYRFAWTAILLVSAANALVQAQYSHLYAWRYCADSAEQAYVALTAGPGQPPPKAILVTAENEGRAAFWNYTLRANGNGPMLPYLLGEPSLQVVIRERSESPPALPSPVLELVERDSRLALLRP